MAAAHTFELTFMLEGQAEEAAAPAPAAAAAPAPAAPAAAPAAPPPPPPAPAVVKRADGKIIATPYAKKLAKELGVDLATIAGSGPEGRITATDVEVAKGGGGGSPGAPYSFPFLSPT